MYSQLKKFAFGVPAACGALNRAVRAIAMTYPIHCECGAMLEVTSAQAGGDLPCHCGRRVRIPALSELRQMAGLAPHETSAVDTINRMIRQGDLPWGDVCAVSGMPTADCVTLHVQCESKWVQGAGEGRPRTFLRAILFVFGYILIKIGPSPSNPETNEVGRERSVVVPLLVREEHQAPLRKSQSQSKLRELLRSVPIYAELLDEFPEAQISVHRSG